MATALQQKGGYDPDWFINLSEESKNNFTCGICMCIARNAVECTNEHMFCLECITDWTFRGVEASKCCPSCRAPADYGPRRDKDKIILSQHITCPMDGCLHSFLLRNLSKHLLSKHPEHFSLFMPTPATQASMIEELPGSGDDEDDYENLPPGGNNTEDFNDDAVNDPDFYGNVFSDDAPGPSAEDATLLSQAQNLSGNCPTIRSMAAIRRLLQEDLEEVYQRKLEPVHVQEVLELAEIQCLQLEIEKQQKEMVQRRASCPSVRSRKAIEQLIQENESEAPPIVDEVSTQPRGATCPTVRSWKMIQQLHQEDVAMMAARARQRQREQRRSSESEEVSQQRQMRRKKSLVEKIRDKLSKR